MSKKNNCNTKENNHALACPHCGAGADRSTVGLFWDSNEDCFRCVICGYRGHEQKLQPKTQALIASENIWDQLMEAIDKEGCEQSRDVS